MNYQEEFPALKNGCYLNTSSSGLLSNSLQNWRRSHDQAFLQSGSGFRVDQASFLESVRCTVLDFLEAGNATCFLVPNASIGFNCFLDGLEGHKRVLLLDQEYPSLYYPIQSRKFEWNQLAVTENLEQDLLDRIEQYRPELFVYSMVQYQNGIKLDADFIRGLKTKYPELIIVGDGTQYLGTEPFNFQESALDAVVCSAYKWLLGGYGNGFICLRKEIASQLYQGCGEQALPTEVFLQHKSPLSFRFEPGHLDTLSFGSMQHSMMALQKIGLKEIGEKLESIGATAFEAFKIRKLLEPAVAARKKHSTIFRLQIAPEAISAILAAGIIAVARGYGIRVSFHLYNEIPDLEYLLKVLDRIS